MKREIMEDLLSWKRSEKKQCLLVIGARQTGKTYLVREFGKSYESKIMEINFEFDLEARKIFEGDLQIDQIIIKSNPSQQVRHFYFSTRYRHVQERLWH